MTRQRHSLCGIPVEIESDEPPHWRLARSSLPPELRISVRPADRIPAPSGTRLFDGPYFSVWESGDRLAIHLQILQALNGGAKADYMMERARFRLARIRRTMVEVVHKLIGKEAHGWPRVIPMAFGLQKAAQPTL